MGNERKLPYSFDGTPIRGLFSKMNSDLMGPGHLEQCDNWDFFKEYAAVSKMRGTRPILSSVYTEGTTKSIHSVHFYKYLDNAGRQRRHVLIGAGTTIQRVNTSTGALTAGVTGAKDRRWNATMFERFMLFANQNQFLIGDGNRPVKYDGDTFSNLGIEAPGSAGSATAKESFDDSSVFTGLVNVVLADESTITLDGASTKVTPGVSSTASQFERSYTAFAIVADVSNRVELNVYIEQGDFEKLATSGAALAVRFESSATDYYEFHVERGELVEGWNIITFNFTAAPDGTDGTSAGTLDTLNVTKITWSINTVLAADQVNLYFDKMPNMDRGTVFAEEPAGAETTILSFDSLNADSSGTGWVTNGTNTAIVFNSTNATEPTAGPLAAQLAKNDTGTVNLDVSNSGGGALNMDISTAVGNTALLDVFVQTPSDLENTIGIEIWLGEDTGFASAAVYAFSGSSLEIGANTLSLDLLNPTRGIGGGVSLADVDFFRCRFIYASATTTDTKTYAVDNFRINTPTSSGGAITGTHSYRVSFVTKYGLESNLGPISNEVVMSTLGGDISLTLIPVSADTQVIARNIYRTSDGGSEHLLVTRLNDNVTTTYTDITSDLGLGVQGGPIAGDLLIDNSPPPDNVGFFTVWKRTVFAAGNPNSPNII